MIAKCVLLLAVCAVIGVHSDAISVPKPCPAHETYFACGADCQTTCSTLNKPCDIRHFRCPDDCYCDPGYARDDSGKCILISKCPKIKEINIGECPTNERWFFCGENCQTECATLGQECRIVHKRCPSGCYCEKGFARDGSGTCIPIKQCKPCPDNELYSFCASPCQNTCATLGQKCQIIPIRCQDGCYCKTGWARNSSGVCIPEAKCKTRHP